MRTRKKTIALLASALLPFIPFTLAAADFSGDFTPSSWSEFFSEAFRSIDVVGFVLLTFLIVVIGMCLDLIGHLRVNRLIPEDLLSAVQEEMSNGEYEKALEYCEKSNCLIGQVFSAALMKTDYSFERMQEALRGEIGIQGLVWRQWIRQFKTVAIAAPLLGLIGAAIHAMRFVSDLAGRPNLGLALASSFEMRALAYNFFTALLLGLLMSIIALSVYSLCSAKLEKILLEANRLGEELLDPFRPLPPAPEE